MSIFTLSELEEQIAAYKAALKALATHQSWTVDGMTFTRADLPKVRETLEWLATERNKLSGKAKAVTVIGRPAR